MSESADNQASEPPPRSGFADGDGNPVEFSGCQDCGAVIVNPHLHSLWHGEVRMSPAWRIARNRSS